MSTRYRILVVEDDPNMLRGIRDNLEIEGYEALGACSIAEARTAVRLQAPDLMILDRMLPDGDGMLFCRESRRLGYSQPIVLLTAKGEEIDRVVGLESGADDYVVKPFSLRELLVRVRILLRRARASPTDTGPVLVGVAEVDFQRHRLLRAGVELEVSARELELLRYLVAHRGRVVSRDALLENVWGKTHALETRTVDNFVVRLRKKIELDPAMPRVLITVHGQGYKLLEQ
jgi:DNA-binding response OmpR family regulator